jgi:hypothetical protein
MTDLSGITVTPGILPAQLRESLEKAVYRIGAKLADTVRIDTTHFVTTEGRGQAWEKAVEMNIPVVRPEWVEGCERGGRLVGVRQYYLNADPRLRDVGQSVNLQQQQQHQQQQQQQQQQARQPENRPDPVPHEGSQQSHEAAIHTPMSDSHPTTNGNSAHGEDDKPPAPPPKDGKSSDEDDEDDADVEQKERSTSTDDNKVWMQDRETQKVAIHPPVHKDSMTPQTNTTGELEDGEHTSGDGGSFSEVAL